MAAGCRGRPQTVDISGKVVMVCLAAGAAPRCSRRTTRRVPSRLGPEGEVAMAEVERAVRRRAAAPRGKAAAGAEHPVAERIEGQGFRVTSRVVPSISSNVSRDRLGTSPSSSRISGRGRYIGRLARREDSLSRGTSDFTARHRVLDRLPPTIRQPRPDEVAVRRRAATTRRPSGKSHSQIGQAWSGSRFAPWPRRRNGHRARDGPSGPSPRPGTRHRS